jgi:hypothetical protein
MAMSMPFQFYSINLFGLNWTIDRILLVSLLPNILLHFYSTRIRESAYTYFILIWLFLIIVNFLIFQATNGSDMFKKLPSYFLTVSVLLLSVTVMKKDLLRIFDKVLMGHIVVLLFFGFYSIYYLWILKEGSFKPPFMSENNYLKWSQSGAHMIGLMSKKRLTFPFATSPFLSFTVGFLTLYGFFKLYIRENRLWYIFVPSLFIILLGTFSKSGILAFVISISIVYFFQKNIKGYFNSKPLLVLIVIVFVALPISIRAIGEILDLQMLSRIIVFDTGNENSSFSSHLSIRIKIIKEISSSNFINMFFGYGIGGTQKYLGVSSGHMSFATVLYDLGLVGLFSFSFLWLYPIIKIIKRSGVGKRPKEIFILSSSIFLVFCHMFYNATTFVFLWLYLGWCVNYVFESQKIKII